MLASRKIKLPNLLSLRAASTKAQKENHMKQNLVLRQDLGKKETYKFLRSKPTDRRVYVWGMAKTGALGLNERINDKKLASIVRFPTRQPFAERHDVLDIAAGYGFTLFAIKREKGDTTLFGSGLNLDSQIGYNKLGGHLHTPFKVLLYPAPITLPKKHDDENTDIVKCAAGRSHSLALSKENVLFTLGNNSMGQCARPVVEGENYGDSRMVHRTEGKELCAAGDEIEDILCGLDHSLLKTKNGKVFSCGWGADGQTGLGHYQSTDHWCKVAGDIKNEKIVKVVSKYDSVLALNDKGEVFGWGNNEYSQLDDSKQQVSTPIHIKKLDKLGKIVDIACGGSICIALNDNGKVFVWGYGILGLGPNVDSLATPTKIPETLFGRNDFNPHSRITAVYAGFAHFGAVADNNNLYMWGRNRSCCLGVLYEKDQYFPFQVPVNSMIEKIDMGVDHTVAYSKAFV